MTGLFAVLLLLLLGPYLLPLPELVDAKTPQELARPGGDFVTVDFPGTSGVEFYFERDAGAQHSGGQPTFVLLHGFAANLRAWDDVRPALADYGEVIAYDRVPFGLSQRLLPQDWSLEDPYTTEAAAVQLHALLELWGVERAILVGNSEGGALAMQMALRHPERVEALILLSPAVYSGDRAALGLVSRIAPLRRLGMFISRRFAHSGSLLDLAYHEPERITEQKRRDAAIIAQVADWDKALWHYLRRPRAGGEELAERLGTLQLPVLLISGEHDRVIPAAETRRLSEEVAGSQLVILPDCGHLPQDECPQAVNTAITDWLRRAGERY